jgi:hypothetical protein
MTFLSSSSFFAWKPAVDMSTIFSSLPLSVSPLPAAPWQEAHFDFHVRSIFLSAWASAEAPISIAVAPIDAARRRCFMTVSSS